MKLLVIAATKDEILPLYKHFGLPEENFAVHESFDLLITGVGMTATAFALGQHLSQKYVGALNLGLAGCFNQSVPLGSLVQVTTDQLSELGAEDGDKFLPVSSLGFGDSNFSPIPLKDLIRQHMPMMVSGITVNTVHGDERSIAKIRRRLNPDTESMEGAAVFYCCEQLGIPCLQIRAISNYVEPRNRANWNIGLAIKNLNAWAIQYLTNN